MGGVIHPVAQGRGMGPPRDHRQGEARHGRKLPHPRQGPGHPLHREPPGDGGGEETGDRGHPDPGGGDEEGERGHPLHDLPHPQNFIIYVNSLQPVFQFRVFFLLPGKTQLSSF